MSLASLSCNRTRMPIVVPHMTPMSRDARDVLLMIADISGYTRFMVANQTELAHSHMIIGALLESIIAEVEIPLTVAKLEGDAVFVYFLKEGDAAASLGRISEKLPRFFSAFSSKLRDLAITRNCSCGACANIHLLRLKVVAHSGTALLYSIAGGTELAGVDVIMVHRLLKNSIPSHEYLLLTEAAQKDLNLGLPVLATATEKYADLGSVRVTAYEVPMTGSAAVTATVRE